MLSAAALYRVVEAMAPLYTAALLGYASVRWFHAFTAEQCSGVSRFVSFYAVPFLIFKIVSNTNPYGIHGRFIAADTLQKAILLLCLLGWAAWKTYRNQRSQGEGKDSPLRCVVTAFSVAALPNTVIMGVPLLNGMYGEMAGVLMREVVAMQFVLWYNIVILFYCMAAPARDDLENQENQVSESPSTTVAPSGSEPAVISSSMENQMNQSSELPGTTVAPPGSEPAGTSSSTENQENQASDSPGTTVAPRGKEPAGSSSSAENQAPDEIQVVIADELAAAATATTTSNDAAIPKEDEAVRPSARQPPVFWAAAMKLFKIPNTYGSFFGLIWALIAFRFGIQMPAIVENSLSVVNVTAVGLSMFSAGMFVARQPSFVACGYKIGLVSMVLKFFIGPLLMLVSSLAVDLHGKLFQIAVVQAALPLAVTSFVYADYYNVHADVMSTGVILGICASLPIAIIYYVVLGLMTVLEPGGMQSDQILEIFWLEVQESSPMSDLHYTLKLTHVTMSDLH